MIKAPRWAYFSIIICGIYIYSFVISAITGSLTISLSGFGIDRQGRLYLGLEGRIEVWQNGEFIKRIAKRYTQRGYEFIIPDGEHIILDCGHEEWIVLDLDGVEIKRIPTARRLRNIIQEKYVPYVAPDGLVYEARESLLGFYITREGEDGLEIIHRMDIWQGIYRLLGIPILIVFALTTGVFSKRDRANMRKKR